MLISEIYHPHAKTLINTATVHEAIEYLAEQDVNALVVINADKKVVGVVSLQDIAAATVPSQFRKNVRMAAAMYKRGFFTEMCQQLKDAPIKQVMRKDFVTVDFDDNIMAITADFLKNDLYVVPVIQKGKLMGVVTRTEIRKALLYGMRNTEKEKDHA